MKTDNVTSAENQQERSQIDWTKNIDPNIAYYLVGFVDGEGSFNVSLRPRKDYKNKWRISLSFNVSQNEDTVLKVLMKTLKCGTIRKRYDGVYYFEVTKLKDILACVIPFFNTFSFISYKKRINFIIFSKIAFLLNIKPLSKENEYKVLLLREKLNKGKGRKRKYSINNIFQSFEKSSETIR